MTVRRNNRACRRGTATVEAVVALPVIVILFIGVFFIRSITSGKLEADEEARRCAWEYSMNGCDAVPEGCAEVVAKEPLGPGNPDVEGAWETGIAKVQGGDFAGAIVNLLNQTVLQPLAEAFTQSLRSNKLIERDRPQLFGSGKSQVTGKYHLACNLKPKTADQVVDEAWDFVVPF